MNAFDIAGRAVGTGHPALVIAEIGVNHDGSLARALELVEIAAECGADAVKLQLFKADRLVHASAGFAGYQRDRCADADPAAMLRRYELAPSAVERVAAAIVARGLIPLATPFSPADVAAIASLDLPAVKIASPDLVNRPLLARAAMLGKPMLVSTGAATVAEVAKAVEWLSAWGVRFALLHCVSSYPAADDDANLCWIEELAARFDVPVGYSDHTAGEFGGALAVARGACVVEKHLTYSRAAVGPDHAASCDADQFAAYVRGARAAGRMAGTPGKRVLPCEQDVRRVSRQSVVLCNSVRPGQVLREADLTIQRPGTGVPAAMLDRVVGRRAGRPISAGTMLQWDMLSDAIPDAA